MLCLIVTIVFLILFLPSIAIWLHYDGKGEGWGGIPWFCLSGFILSAYATALLILWLNPTR